MSAPHILIIKHSALGDIILATGPMKAIRQAHPDAEITLLTTSPYDQLMEDCPFIDHIIVDERPKWWQLKGLQHLKRRLQSRHWQWVYDLQTSRRSTAYYRWLDTQYYSGLHPDGSHPHDTPERTQLHTIDRQKQQLEIAGIAQVPLPDISWLNAPLPDAVKEAQRLALLVAGGSAHRTEKRWPHFAELAERLCEQQFTPVLIGTQSEANILQAVAKKDRRIINLCNQTSFAQLASLARTAAWAVGNDTGPMHIIAAAGCPSTVLFNTRASNPELCAPRGTHIRILKSDDLNALTVDFVNKPPHNN